MWSTYLSNNSSLVQRGLKGNERIAVCHSPTELNNVAPDLCDECLICVCKKYLSLTLELQLCHWVGKLHSVDLCAQEMVLNDCGVTCMHVKLQVHFFFLNNCFAICNFAGFNEALYHHFDGAFAFQIDQCKYFSEVQLLWGHKQFFLVEIFSHLRTIN